MLDPSRYALDAATVGFRKRMGLSVDWGSFNNAIQNQTDAIKVRRELEETAVTELHVMGGERFGIAGNEKTNTAARQARQMNGYPLRSFLATGGAIVVPPKHGEGLMMTPMNMGLTQYTQYNGVVGNYVSSFTEPLNAPLDNQSILLGRAGIKARSESASDPYKAMQFMLNMHSTQDEINANAMAHENLRGYNQQGSMADQMADMEAPMAAAAKKRRFEESVANAQAKRQGLGAPRNVIVPPETPPNTARSDASSVASSAASTPMSAGRPAGRPPLTPGRMPPAKDQPVIRSDLHSSLTSSVHSTPRERSRDEGGVVETIHHDPVLENINQKLQEDKLEGHLADFYDELDDTAKVLFDEEVQRQYNLNPTRDINNIKRKIVQQIDNTSSPDLEKIRQNHLKDQQNMHATSFSSDSDPNIREETYGGTFSLNASMASYPNALRTSVEEARASKDESVQTEVQKSYSFTPSPAGNFAQQDSSISRVGVFTLPGYTLTGKRRSPSGIQDVGGLSASPFSHTAGYSPTLETLASPNYQSSYFSQATSAVKNLFGSQKTSVKTPGGAKVKQTFVEEF